MTLNCENLSKTFLNITTIINETPFFSNFHEVDGKIVLPEKRNKIFWKDYQFYTRTLNTWIVEPGNNWGIWHENAGYIDGIFGAIQANKANKPWLPVSMDTKDPPGVLTAYQHSELYIIISFVKDQLKLIGPDLISSLIIIEPVCWIMYLLFILCFKIFDRYENQYHWISSDILFYTWETALKQGYIKERSDKNKSKKFTKCILIIFEGFLISIFMCICGASFSTQAIISQPDNRVNDLKDIVRLDKRPYFVDGFSAHHLFVNSSNFDFKSVFNHAKRKETSEPVPSTEVLGKFRADQIYDVVILITENAAHAMSKVIPVIFNKDIKIFISRPYSRPLQMSLFNPIDKGCIGQELVRRDRVVTTRMIEGASEFYTKQKLQDFINSELGGSKSDLLKKPNEDEIEFHVQPLKISQFVGLFQMAIVGLVTSLLIELSLWIYSVIYSPKFSTVKTK